MPEPRHTRSFNVLLTEPDYARLVTLARVTNCTKAHAMRAAFLAACTQIIDQQPVCANGQRCFVPHMHAPPVTLHPQPQPRPLETAPMPIDTPTQDNPT